MNAYACSCIPIRKSLNMIGFYHKLAFLILLHFFVGKRSGVSEIRSLGVGCLLMPMFLGNYIWK